jgi:N-acetylneuraminic acid mutarotase
MDMWTTKAWIPYDSFASIGMNAAALGANGNVYLMGGLVNPDPARVAEYNPITNSWRMMNSYKMQYSARAVTLNNQIYFMGGCPFRSMGDCDNPSDSFQIYDPVLDAWEDQPPMLYAHTGHAVTVYNNKVYVMGGTPMSSPLPNKTFEVFDPLTGKWTLLPPLPEAMINFGCCAVGNKIYIIGQNHMYEYTPD